MRPLTDVHAFSDIVGRIYSASLDPARWGDVVEGLHDYSGGMKTQLFGHDASTGLNLGMVTCGYEPEFLMAYEEHFGAINPWVRGMTEAASGKVLSADEMCPFDDMRASEFYNDWVRPQGDIRGGGGLMLFNDDERVIMLGANIEHGRIERLEADWLTLCTLLRPHLQQAFEISRQVGEKRLAVAAAGAAEREDAPLILAGESGRVIYASRLGQDMLAAGRVVQVDLRNRVRFRDAKADAAFRDAFSYLGADNHARPQTLAVPDGARRLTCRIVSFGKASAAQDPVGVLCSAGEPCILLCFEDAPGSVQSSLLAETFGLTPAEAEVAELISAGYSPADIAAHRGVSIHTTRNQLKAAMMKCETPRQADLTRLILTLDKS